MTRGQKWGLICGLGGGLLGIVVPLVSLWWMLRPAPPREPLPPRLDSRGPYLILATQHSATDYARAIEKAAALHPGAQQQNFDPQDLTPVLETLRKIQPRYVLVFIQPDELDVNFAWRWLTLSTQVDDDPLVDVCTGFITGATPQAAEAFVDRIAAVVAGQVQLPGALVDNFGPPEQGDQQYFNTFPVNTFLPVFADRFSLRSIAHGKGGFTDERLATMDDAGVVHFGGHGHPERIDDGLTATQVERLRLAPCVVFNGACYTGVTRRWFDVSTWPPTERTVEAADCFCLQLLENKAVAYLAALHPDHGMPVYQEMEYWAYTGASLGEVIKHTHDGVVLGGGGRLPKLESLGGTPQPAPWTPTDVMLKGTAARILFGDPALIIGPAFTPPPFAVQVTETFFTLQIAATLQNAALKSEYTDTYHHDLSPNAPFNDRALVVCDLPHGWTAVKRVTVTGVTVRGTPVPHRMVGQAVEWERGEARLHVQVDLRADGFQQSAFRTPGATVTLTAQPSPKPR